MELAGVISGAVGTVVSIVTLLTLFLRGVFSLERRLTKLETQIEPFWDALRKIVVDVLQGMSPAGNPISQERWEHLLKKFRDNTLSTEEASELKNAMVEKTRRSTSGE